MARNDFDNRAIDLGLSVLWAEKNLGDTPAGGYFGWGILYPWEHEGSYYLNFENPPEDICGNPEFDIARKKYGAPWRLPSAAEMEELIERCKWEWEEAGDTAPFMAGYRVTGPNGNSIFLPAGGYGRGTVREEAYVDGDGSYGAYWSGNLCEEKGRSFELYFREGNMYVYQEWRSRGNNIRPVCAR